MRTTKLAKNLLAIGLISTVKIAAEFLLKDDNPKKIEESTIEIEKTDLSEILDSIRGEMNSEMDKLPESQKMLRNYLRGRIATIDDIEKRI